MNNDTNKPQDLTGSQGLGLPPIPSVAGAAPVSMPTIETPPTTPEVPSLPPIEVKTETPVLVAETPPVTTTTTTIGSGGGLPPIEVKTETTGPAEKKPKKKANIKMVVGGILAFFLLAGAAAVSYLLPGFRGDIRQRASYSCNGYCTADTCADNGDVPGSGTCSNPSAPNCCKAPSTTSAPPTTSSAPPTTSAAACTLGATKCQGNNQPWRCTCVAVASGNVWNCTTPDPSCGTGTTTTTTTTAGGTCGTCGGSGQACCVPENCGATPICNAGLYCNSGVCTTGTAICGGSQGEGGSAGGQCKVYKCGTKCNNGNQCSQGGETVACAGASLGGECGQIDYLNETGGYCGVMTQNCYGSCGGTSTTTTTTSPGGTTTTATTTTSVETTTTTGVAPACAGTRVYINASTTAATAAQLAELKIGDTIKLAVRGNRSTFTKGRFVVSVDGTTVVTQESTTKQNLPGDVAAFEFVYEHTITQAGSYSIQGSVWQ